MGNNRDKEIDNVIKLRGNRVTDARGRGLLIAAGDLTYLNGMEANPTHADFDTIARVDTTLRAWRA